MVQTIAYDKMEMEPSFDDEEAFSGNNSWKEVEGTFPSSKTKNSHHVVTSLQLDEGEEEEEEEETREPIEDAVTTTTTATTTLTTASIFNIDQLMGSLDELQRSIVTDDWSTMMQNLSNQISRSFDDQRDNINDDVRDSDEEKEEEADSSFLELFPCHAFAADTTRTTSNDRTVKSETFTRSLQLDVDEDDGCITADVDNAFADRKMEDDKEEFPTLSYDVEDDFSLSPFEEEMKKEEEDDDEQSPVHRTEPKEVEKISAVASFSSSTVTITCDSMNVNDINEAKVKSEMEESSKYSAVVIKDVPTSKVDQDDAGQSNSTNLVQGKDPTTTKETKNLKKEAATLPQPTKVVSLIQVGSVKEIIRNPPPMINKEIAEDKVKVIGVPVSQTLEKSVNEAIETQKNFENSIAQAKDKVNALKGNVYRQLLLGRFRSLIQPLFYTMVVISTAGAIAAAVWYLCIEGDSNLPLKDTMIMIPSQSRAILFQLITSVRGNMQILSTQTLAAVTKSASYVKEIMDLLSCKALTTVAHSISSLKETIEACLMILSAQPLSALILFVPLVVFAEFNGVAA